jgi:KaiC/GvpD/RAD55 family RecA-like ATPase
MINETAAIAAWSADVYAKRDVKPVEPLLGSLTRGCVTLLCGPRGAGKSWLALGLAHAAARGGTLGPWRARRKHRVVFIDAAGSEAVLRTRLAALGASPPSLVIVPGDAQPSGLDLSVESVRTALDELVTDADLVVIDGLSALVRKGRGVGGRWASLEGWLRSLRRRHAAVLLVDAKAPALLADLADTVLKVEPPADGVADADLRLQGRLQSTRAKSAEACFELRLTLRQDGAVWRYIDDVDHRAILAYRLDRQDYSSREIAKRLGVSPATAWRLIGRGERMPAHLRDGVELEVPEAGQGPKSARTIAGLLRESLLPREKEGPVAKRREDEGPAVAATGEIGARGESPSLYPLPRERVPEGAVAANSPTP